MRIMVKFFYGAKNNEKSCKMASYMKKISECVSCFNETKYLCLSCCVPVCNICGKPELDEEMRGYIENRSVGYCKDCLIISKPVEACDQKKATQKLDRYAEFVFVIYIAATAPIANHWQ